MFPIHLLALLHRDDLLLLTSRCKCNGLRGIIAMTAACTTPGANILPLVTRPFLQEGKRETPPLLVPLPRHLLYLLLRLRVLVCCVMDVGNRGTLFQSALLRTRHNFR